MTTSAVLLFSYGSPLSHSEDDVRAYLNHIFLTYRGAPASEDAVQKLLQKYRNIGGSPLRQIMNSLKQQLEARLVSVSVSSPPHVYVGYKHAPPYIEEVLHMVKKQGYKKVGIILFAPFESRYSTGSYKTVIASWQKKMKDEQPIPEITFFSSWTTSDLFLKTWLDLIRHALKKSNVDCLVFTNHSVPEQVLQEGDPYHEQFLDFSHRLASAFEQIPWRWAYQSAGGGKASWLGPDVQQVLEDELQRGKKSFLLVPVGFFVDHLEVRYDIDIVLKNWIRQKGGHIVRTDMPNTHPLFVEALYEICLNLLSN